MWQIYALVAHARIEEARRESARHRTDRGGRRPTPDADRALAVRPATRGAPRR